MAAAKSKQSSALQITFVWKDAPGITMPLKAPRTPIDISFTNGMTFGNIFRYLASGLNPLTIAAIQQESKDKGLRRWDIYDKKNLDEIKVTRSGIIIVSIILPRVVYKDMGERFNKTHVVIHGKAIYKQNMSVANFLSTSSDFAKIFKSENIANYDVNYDKLIIYGTPYINEKVTKKIQNSSEARIDDFEVLHVKIPPDALTLKSVADHADVPLAIEADRADVPLAIEADHADALPSDATSRTHKIDPILLVMEFMKELKLKEAEEVKLKREEEEARRSHIPAHYALTPSTVSTRDDVVRADGSGFAPLVLSHKRFKTR